MQFFFNAGNKFQDKDQKRKSNHFLLRMQKIYEDTDKEKKVIKMRESVSPHINEWRRYRILISL